MKMTTTAKHQQNVIQNIKQIKTPPPSKTISFDFVPPVIFLYIKMCSFPASKDNSDQ